MKKAKEREWHQKPIRAIQTILRTCDAPEYDADKFIDFALRNHANAVIINGGGLRAFYPTQVPGHTVVEGLTGDIVSDVCERASAVGLKVLARVDFRAGSEAAFTRNPEWFARDEGGDPKTIRGLYTAAATSPYRADGFAYEVVRELLTNYSLDGIWENAAGFVHATPGKRPAYSGSPIDVLEIGADAADFGLVDYSNLTARKFEDETGFRLPHPDRFEAHAYLAYIEWRYGVVTARTSEMRAVIKAEGEHLAYIAETPGILQPGWSRTTAQDTAELAPLFDILTLPTFGVTREGYGSAMLPTPPWRPTEVTAHLRSAKPGTAPGIMFGRFDNASRYTSSAPEDLDLWLASGLAQGGGSWECTFVGRSDEEFHDRRADTVVEAHYSRTEALTPLLDNAESIAHVAVVHSTRAEMLFSATDPAKDQYVQHSRGAISALLGAHIPFDILPDTQLVESAGRYKVLLLPNLAVLDDSQVAELQTFVAGGGAVVATGAPGARSATGMRDRLPLEDVLGVTDAGRTLGPLPNAYGYFEGQGPIVDGLGATDMITTEGTFRVVEAADGAEVPLSLVEQIAPQPPELGWIDLSATARQPFAVVNHYGKGRSVYFPGEIDRHVASSGHPDHALLLTNAVRWATGVPEPVTADAPVGVHISPLRSSDGRSLVISLVNYSSAPQRPITEVIPVRNVRVIVQPELLVGSDRHASWRVRDLLDGGDLPYEQAADGLRVTLGELGAYAAIRIEAHS